VAAGTCQITSTLTGTFTLNANYPGDTNFNPASAAATASSFWQFFGFDSPLGPDGTLIGPFNLGRNLTVKWALKDGSGNLLTSVENTRKSLNVQGPFACGAAPSGPVVLLDPSATGNTSLRFSSNQFVFNWDTTGYGTGCFQLQLSLKDGSLHTSTVQLQ